jgi:hypothetical protein
MKTFINILKTLGFVAAYFTIVAVVGVLLPTKIEVKPDATAMGAFLLHLIVNSFFIIYLLKRLSLKGFRLIAVTVLTVYGIQIFMTQIETWIFINAFPSITPDVLTNIVVTNLIQIVVVTIVGYFLWKPKLSSTPDAKLSINISGKWWKVAALSVLYMILYFTFGYYIAWQYDVLREFYHGSVSSISNTELVFIQIGRGALWVLFCLPSILYLKSGRTEKVIIMASLMAILPTILLLMPNPFMPLPIRMAHFIEVFLSNGIFGTCIALLMTAKPGISKKLILLTQREQKNNVPTKENRYE